MASVAGCVRQDPSEWRSSGPGNGPWWNADQTAARINSIDHWLSRQWLRGRVLVQPASAPGGKARRVALHLFGEQGDEPFATHPGPARARIALGQMPHIAQGFEPLIRHRRQNEATHLRAARLESLCAGRPRERLRVVGHGRNGPRWQGKGLADFGQAEQADRDIKPPSGPDLAAHHGNFLDAIRTGVKLNADVTINHLSTSLCHLGNIAARTRKALVFDPVKEPFIGGEVTSKLLRREYRDHWAQPAEVVQPSRLHCMSHAPSAARVRFTSSLSASPDPRRLKTLDASRRSLHGWPSRA